MALSNTRPGDRVLREPEVHERTGLSKTHRHALIAAGQFPRKIKLTPNGRSSGWLESEIDAWLASRVAARDQGAAA